jgi:hypothetical protein
MMADHAAGRCAQYAVMTGIMPPINAPLMQPLASAGIAVTASPSVNANPKKKAFMFVRSGVRSVPVAMWVRPAAKQEAADRCDPPPLWCLRQRNAANRL